MDIMDLKRICYLFLIARFIWVSSPPSLTHVTVGLCHMFVIILLFRYPHSDIHIINKMIFL